MALVHEMALLLGTKMLFVKSVNCDKYHIFQGLVRLFGRGAQIQHKHVTRGKTLKDILANGELTSQKICAVNLRNIPVFLQMSVAEK